LLSMMVYGTPIVPERIGKVDEDLMDIDKDRKYPEDSDYAKAYIKDVIDYVSENYKEEDTKVQIRIDGLVMTVDEIMEVAL